MPPRPDDPTARLHLDGRIARGAGGSRGLGKEMVRTFGAVGTDVASAIRKLHACEALAKEIESETGQRPLAIACQVADREACDALAKRALAPEVRVYCIVLGAFMTAISKARPEPRIEAWREPAAVAGQGAPD